MAHAPTLLAFGGALHFALVLAQAFVPRFLDWKHELAPLSPALRRLVWVYGVFLVLANVGFGAISLLHPDVLASGAPLARSFCAFVALYWVARLAVGLFVFRPAELLARAPSPRVARLGYHGLNATFVYFVAVYGSCALGAGA
jgi:hypothetical protein